MLSRLEEEGLTHRGDIGQLVLSFLGGEQVCLALLDGGSPQSSNNGNMARDKDITLSVTTTLSTKRVRGVGRSAGGTFSLSVDLTLRATQFGGMSRDSHGTDVETEAQGGYYVPLLKG